MKTRHCKGSEASEHVAIEVLEDRRFLSASLPVSGGVTGTSVNPTTPITVAPATWVLKSDPIYAVATEAFKAVLGTITIVSSTAASALPVGYTYNGTVTWGDGSKPSTATFVKQTNNIISVEGSHTYTKAGSDAITVTITRIPPPGTTLPIVLVGTLHTTATVVADSRGVTLNETAGDTFTATLGTFSTPLSLNTLTATITWGDGAVSIGRILALPVAAGSPVGGFAVEGTHSYLKTASYLVNISVTSRPTATTGGGASSTVIVVVANIQSVIDLLPPSPVVTA